MSENSLLELRGTEFDNANVLTIEEIPEYDIDDYDLFNPKQFKKYINEIESLVRSSREYREYVQYLRIYMGMNYSLYLPGVTNVENTKIKIELHHTPFTLFDIVMTVFNKRSRLQEPLEVELIAKEVCFIHYHLLIGLVPLSKTEHILVHNQELFVRLDKVLGNYEKFIDMYIKDIPEDAMDRYKFMKEQTLTYNHDQNTRILNVAPTYLKVPNTDQNTLGSYNNSQLTDVMTLTQERIKEISQANNRSIEYKSYDNNPVELVKPFTIEKQPELIRPFTINVAQNI